jgi:hypothetical protein
VKFISYRKSVKSHSQMKDLNNSRTIASSQCVLVGASDEERGSLFLARRL